MRFAFQGHPREITRFQGLLFTVCTFSFHWAWVGIQASPTETPPIIVIPQPLAFTSISPWTAPESRVWAKPTTSSAASLAGHHSLPTPVASLWFL